MSLADYVLDLIRRDLGLPSRREWFERLAAKKPVNIPLGVIADAIRAEREAQIAAALGLEEAETEDAEGDDAGRH
jgi:hypothetical protein